MTIASMAGRVPEWTLSDRLRKARELTGHDRTQFAGVLGVSRTTITNAEQGHKQPREITVRAWAMATGVSLEWLKTGEAPSPDGDGASMARPEGFEPPTFCSVVELVAA